MDNELYTEKIYTNNKKFLIDLKKNQAGYYLKLSEFSNNKKTCVYIPTEGLEQIVQGFEKIKSIINQEDSESNR